MHQAWVRERESETRDRLGDEIDFILGEGSDFQALEPLRLRLAVALGGDAAMGPGRRADLLLRLAAIALLRDADLGSARLVGEEGLECAVRAGSVPLRLAFESLLAVADCLAGEVTRADVRLADAFFLCDTEAAPLLEKVLVHSAAGLVALLLGEVERAHATLGAAWNMKGFTGLPAAVGLPVLAHRVYAAADMACAEEARALADLLGEQVIPPPSRLLNGYRHLALGVLALRRGDALRARVHADECCSAAAEGQSCLLRMLGELLVMQAQADQHAGAAARASFSACAPRWLAGGLRRLAAIGHQELAMLDARAGDFDRARQQLACAQELLPTGESLIPLHRPVVWRGELEALLDPARRKPWIRVRCLGEFEVEIGGRRIFDRDWKGSRTRTLLLALICKGGRKVSVEGLADLLWPDSEGPQAMQNLKVALHRLRRLGCAEDETPVNWVHVKQGMVSLVEGLCEVDALELCAAMPGAPERALALYRGPFMGDDESHAWILEFRARIEQVRAQACAGCGLARPSPRQPEQAD